jgi:hypothetical protein
MFNHLDLVRIPTELACFVWTELEDAEYADLWDSSKFLEPASLKGEPIGIFRTEGAVDKDGCIPATINRKFADGSYLLTVLVTNIASGRFSDQHYLIIDGKNIRPRLDV